MNGEFDLGLLARWVIWLAGAGFLGMSLAAVITANWSDAFQSGLISAICLWQGRGVWKP